MVHLNSPKKSITSYISNNRSLYLYYMHNAPSDKSTPIKKQLEAMKIQLKVQLYGTIFSREIFTHQHNLAYTEWKVTVY